MAEEKEENGMVICQYRLISHLSVLGNIHMRFDRLKNHPISTINLVTKEGWLKWCAHLAQYTQQGQVMTEEEWIVESKFS